jgi:hypothetical protein
MLLTPIVIVGQKNCNFFFLKNEKFHKVQETDLWQKLIFEYRSLDRFAREQRCFSTESFRQQISSSCSYRFLLGAPGEQTAPPPLFHLPIFNPFGFQRSREREKERQRETQKDRGRHLHLCTWSLNVATLLGPSVCFLLFVSLSSGHVVEWVEKWSTKFFLSLFCLFVAPLCFSFSSSRESLSDVVVGNLDQAKHIFKEVAQV